MDQQTELWPGWKTVRLIGHGSFGAVYEIERSELGMTEKAALKVITIPQSDSDIRELLNDGYDEETVTCTFKDYLVSIVSEYNLMRKLNGSSNIVSCDDYRYVQHDDGFGWDIFIKMELLTPLAEALPKEIPEEMALQIGIDICKALVLCAKYNIIHRDIKPQNIFVSPNGDYKLGDFGIAKTVEKTSGGTKVGTYKYMAPEVYNNQPYGASADIYSLGLVMHWLLNEKRLPFLPLTGRLNPKADEEARTRRLQGEALPAPSHGSRELKRIVLKACAYDPKERYHTAEEMLKDLQHANDPIVIPMPVPVSLPIPAPVPPMPPTPPSPEPIPAPPAPLKPNPKPTKKVNINLKVAGLAIIILLLLGAAYGNTRKETDKPSVATDSGLTTIAADTDLTMKAADSDLTTIEKKLESVFVETVPSEAIYFVGDTLDTTGLTLSLLYSDGSTEKITSGFVCDPATLSNTGRQTITVTYDGMDTSFDVTVNDGTKLIDESWENGRITIAALDDASLWLQITDNRPDHQYEDLGTPWSVYFAYGENVEFVTANGNKSSFSSYSISLDSPAMCKLLTAEYEKRNPSDNLQSFIKTLWFGKGILLADKKSCTFRPSLFVDQKIERTDNTYTAIIAFPAWFEASIINDLTRVEVCLKDTDYNDVASFEIR